MSYSQGNLIEATDYNNLINGSNQLNTVWSTGTGNAGYGQTAISTVAVSNTVTATQWATLINRLNSVLTRQSGSGSGISAVTAGQTISWISTLQTNINTSYTNRLNANTTGTVATGTGLAYAAWTSTSTSSTLTRSFGARATFASADQARYFFNSGGKLKFNISATSSGSSRSTAAQNLVGYLGGVTTFNATTNGGRTGTGGTLNTNNTALGYYNITTGNTTVVAVTSVTTNYTTDTANIAVKTNGTQGANADNGTTIDFWATINSTSGGNSGGSFDDSLSLTPTVSIDVTYPETTNLSNTWGAVTITQL